MHAVAEALVAEPILDEALDIGGDRGDDGVCGPAGAAPSSPGNLCQLLALFTIPIHLRASVQRTSAAHKRSAQAQCTSAVHQPL